jgi:hypothetical protein
MIRQAIKGNVRAAKEIADRIEGSVLLRSVAHDREPSKVTIISPIPRPDRTATVAPNCLTAG